MNPSIKKSTKKKSFSIFLSLMSALVLTFQFTGCDKGSFTAHSSFTEIDSPAGLNSQSPRLSQDLQGNPLLSWIELEGERSILKYSVMRQDQWSLSQEVARGDDWVINGSDTPSVVQLSESLMAAHWLVKNPNGSFAYDIFTSHSQNNGKTWSNPVTPHTDGTAVEHGFANIYKTSGEGGEGYGLVWLDSANVSMKIFADSVHSTSGVSLRSALIDLDGSIYEEQLVDFLVCDCCPTALTQGSQGPIVAYRNRDETEQRDIFYTQLRDGHWSKPSPVGFDDWHIAGCPVNGPAIASVGNTVAIAWFTAAGGRKSVRIAISRNGGVTFEPQFEIDHGDTLGRVSLAMDSSKQITVSWLTVPKGSKFAQIQLAAYDLKSGPLSQISQDTIILETNKPVGVPVMASLASGGGILAWTAGGVRGPRVKVFSWTEG